ncbi:MAG: glycerol-3-phosphate dehydrogenase/oxidase [Candidatus Polarisedimenticolaceae bacterium]|nr:glycerol-3-phosphate dehydrogenase/oxidase [Candidatus Polarisedimenticolaceae bacterium]
MAEYTYDLAIIGGGIHGVSVAQAAAAKGYSVLLLEQSALAAGTSSRSSKLIHGGLRYLESAQFNVVRECLTERALLLKLAPELVQLIPFYSPIYRNTQRRPWQISIGLNIYRALGGFQQSGEFSRLSHHQWHNLDGLTTDNLNAVFRFWDAQTDDAQLTQAVMRSAQSLGAELVMPAQFIAAELDKTGATLSYQHNGRQHSCRVRTLINAAGPWVNLVLQKITPTTRQCHIDLVQGSHILLPNKLNQGIFYVEAPQDQRAVFLMPWQGNTLIGTTEHHYQGDPAKVQPLPEEESYLMEVAAHYFPHLAALKVIDSFAGLRVLPTANGSPFGRSRETILLTDRSKQPRVLTIYGGKLTAYRAAAEAVLLKLHTTLPERKAIADTRLLPLSPP